MTNQKFIIFQFDKHDNVLSNPIVCNSANVIGEKLRSPEMKGNKSKSIFLYDTCAKYAIVQINILNGMVITKGEFSDYGKAVDAFDSEDLQNITMEKNYVYGLKSQYLFILLCTEYDEIMESRSFSYEMEKRIKYALESFAFRMISLYGNVFECAKFKRISFDRKGFSMMIYRDELTLFYKKKAVLVFNVSDKKHPKANYINPDVTEWGFDYIIETMDKNEKDIKKLNKKLEIIF